MFSQKNSTCGTHMVILLLVIDHLLDPTSILSYTLTIFHFDINWFYFFGCDNTTFLFI
jgi:hypothetical protein